MFILIPCSYILITSKRLAFIVIVTIWCYSSTYWLMLWFFRYYTIDRNVLWLFSKVSLSSGHDPWSGWVTWVSETPNNPSYRLCRQCKGQKHSEVLGFWQLIVPKIYTLLQGSQMLFKVISQMLITLILFSYNFFNHLSLLRPSKINFLCLFLYLEKNHSKSFS